MLPYKVAAIIPVILSTTSKIRQKKERERELDVHVQHIASCLPAEWRKTIDRGILTFQETLKTDNRTYPWKELGCVY
jgi:hypothetical protein